LDLRSWIRSFYGPDPFPECGLKSTFRTLETGEVEGVFTPDVKHSGYEGVIHGGIIMGFLDEVLGRLAFTRDRLFLTRTLEVTFRKASSPGKRLKAVAQEVEWSKRRFKAAGTVTDEDGDVVATARGTFLLMSEKMERELLPENFQNPGARIQPFDKAQGPEPVEGEPEEKP
jgi:uncharacterized protein (TIGR00369 family)